MIAVEAVVGLWGYALQLAFGRSEDDASERVDAIGFRIEQDEEDAEEGGIAGRGTSTK